MKTLILILTFAFHSLAFAELEQGLVLRIDRDQNSAEAYANYRAVLTGLVQSNEVTTYVRTSTRGNPAERICLELSEIDEDRYAAVFKSFTDLSAKGIKLTVEETDGDCGADLIKQVQ
jgi:hypothetical protein